MRRRRAGPGSVRRSCAHRLTRTRHPSPTMRWNALARSIRTEPATTSGSRCPTGADGARAKRPSGATGHGNSWLRTTMVEVAWTAARSPDGYHGALYRHLALRRGKKCAIVAVAHALLVADPRSDALAHCFRAIAAAS